MSIQIRLFCQLGGEPFSILAVWNGTKTFFHCSFSSSFSSLLWNSQHHPSFSLLFLLFRFEFCSSLSFLGFLTKACSEMSAVHKSRVLVLWSNSTLRILFYFTGFCYFFSRLLSGFNLLEDFSLCFRLPEFEVTSGI